MIQPSQKRTPLPSNLIRDVNVMMEGRLFLFNTAKSVEGLEGQPGQIKFYIYDFRLIAVPLQCTKLNLRLNKFENNLKYRKYVTFIMKMLKMACFFAEISDHLH